MNTSWKTNTAGIAAIVAGVANLVVDAIHNGTVSPDAAGIAVTAVIAGIGLINAKDGNVSNSPTPLQVAQPVEQTLAAVADLPHVPAVAVALGVAQTVEKQVIQATVAPAEPVSGDHRF